MKRAATYVGLCALVIGGLAAVGSAFLGPVDRQAVWVSASLAFVVQMVAFMVVQVLPARDLMLGWGLGAFLRLMSVVIFGLFVAKVWRAPVAPALISYALFLFATTVVEPVFLKR